LSKSDPPGRDIFLFDDWVVDAYRRSEGFTALVVLVGIGDLSVVPLRSTFLHVIGEDLNWAQLCNVLAGAGVAWDGVVFETLSGEEGGPVADAQARMALRILEQRIAADRMVINEGHFFDKWGRRLKIEEALPQ
jgi:hypothetical protein